MADQLVERARQLVQSIVLTLPNIALGLIALAVFLLAAWALRRLVRTVLARAHQPAGIQRVLSRLVAWTVVTVGVLVGLTFVFPTLNAASLFGALGITSVAIGFAFKDVFQNLLAGVLILLTRPFRIGDQIVTGDHEGTVEDIQIRASLLKTYDGRRVVIPNSELYTNRVVVNTAFDRRRLSAEVGIGTSEDLEAARSVILRAVADLAEVLPDPAPETVVRDLGDFSVLVEIRFWISPPSRREAVVATGRVLEAVKAALDDAGVEMPFPTQQVVLDRGAPPSESR